MAESPFGSDLFGEPVDETRDYGNLFDKFLVPPFTTLDARQGYWKERKAAWLALGIKSEIGREHVATYRPGSGVVELPNGEVRNKDFVGYRIGLANANNAGTSVFDPVLCEIAYLWFCPAGGVILDPFAGGSVRGVVASMLGFRYIGIDLSEKQVIANREQAAAICRPKDPQPQWIVGDSRNAGALVKEDVDAVFSCPPYYDLEVYSDDPADLSKAASYDAFLDAYSEVVRACMARLKPNRFAGMVTGIVRNKKDHWLYDLPTDTVSIFRGQGYELYNTAVLLTSVGSLSVRVPKQFHVNRKMGAAHQSFTVFVKGDPKVAAAACRKPGEEARTEEYDWDPYRDIPELDGRAVTVGAAPGFASDLLPALPSVRDTVAARAPLETLAGGDGGGNNRSAGASPLESTPAPPPPRLDGAELEIARAAAAASQVGPVGAGQVEEAREDGWLF